MLKLQLELCKSASALTVAYARRLGLALGSIGVIGKRCIHFAAGQGQTRLAGQELLTCALLQPYFWQMSALLGKTKSPEWRRWRSDPSEPLTLCSKVAGRLPCCAGS